MLTIEERNSLDDIIAGLYDFTDGGPRARRVLIERANLHRFLTVLDLSGPPDLVASDLVGRLQDFGYLPEYPAYHALGALLSYVIKLKDLPQERARFLAMLIVRYTLVLDPVYIENLGSQYGITETPQPTPAQITPPPALPVSTQSPVFNVAQLDAPGLERIINSADNFLDIYLLVGAIYSAQAVCRIEDSASTPMGTGVLVGPDLLLTCQHVLKNKNYLNGTIARFDYRVDGSGVAQTGTTVKLRTDFYEASDASLLDYALVRLEKAPLKHMMLKGEIDSEEENLSYLDLMLRGKHRGYLVLAEDFLKEHDRVNIIQHPGGQPMKVVLTQNYIVTDMTDTRVQYVADTLKGSSGSPVFNQNWEIVALHHSGEPYPPDSVQKLLQKTLKRHFQVNEGIPMRALLKDFREKDLIRNLPRD